MRIHIIDDDTPPISSYKKNDYITTRYIIMEYCEGIPLAQHLKKSSLNTRILYAVKIAQALNWIHNRKWLHLDIKLAHFIVLQSGKIKIIDFSNAHKISKDVVFNYKSFNLHYSRYWLDKIITKKN